jgi:glycosyltransferase involved in cell wall biosynthesis
MGFLYRRARGVFPVDEGLRTDILEHTRHRGDNIRTIPSGFDPGAFPLGGPKEDLVLTAAYPDEDTFRRKGLDTFIEVARRVPEAQFAIVGAVRDPAVGARVQRSAPPNLALAGAVTREQLLRWYQRARVYCQLSRHEGLPNALCEAMLCEAVPVGTPHYGIPVAIGDAGFIVPWRDPDATAEAVRKALGSDLGPRARRRIAEHFSLERRARDLTAAVEAVLARKPLPSAGAQ